MVTVIESSCWSLTYGPLYSAYIRLIYPSPIWGLIYFQSTHDPAWQKQRVGVGPLSTLRLVPFHMDCPCKPSSSCFLLKAKQIIWVAEEEIRRTPGKAAKKRLHGIPLKLPPPLPSPSEMAGGNLVHQEGFGWRWEGKKCLLLSSHILNISQREGD